MPTQEDIDQQKQLLAAHRRTLVHLLTQQAQFSAGHVPAHVGNGIAEARANIQRVKQTLRGWGVRVANHPGDSSSDEDATTKFSSPSYSNKVSSANQNKGSNSPRVERKVEDTDDNFVSLETIIANLVSYYKRDIKGNNKLISVFIAGMVLICFINSITRSNNNANSSTKTPTQTNSLPSGNATVISQTQRMYDDLPGTPLIIGSTIKSETGGEVRKRDVFAISLEANQLLHINVSSDNIINAYMIYPNATSIDTGSYENLCSSQKICSKTWASATKDTYYIVVDPYYHTNYLLSTKVDNKTFPYQIASNLPGTTLDIGSKVKAILDTNVKGRDVFAISFVSGQLLQVALESNKQVSISIVKPGATSIENTQKQSLCNLKTNCIATFISATTDTYYVIVETLYPQVTYMLSTSLKETINITSVASEVPGTPLNFGVQIQSILDWDIKKRDVYAFHLEAGQTVRIGIESNSSLSVFVIMPEATSVDTSSYETLCRSQKVCFANYTSNRSGTYYVDVEPSSEKVVYTISVNLKT